MTTQAEAPKKVYETKLVSIETINSKTGDLYKSPVLELMVSMLTSFVS